VQNLHLWRLGWRLTRQIVVLIVAVNLLFAHNMVSRRRKWVLAVLIVAIAAAGLFIIASMASKRYQPYIREAAIRYLRERFESEVELGDLQIHMPKMSTLRMLITRGRGAMAEVVGSNLILRHMGRRDVPPMFAIKHFQFTVDLGLLFGPAKKVTLVQLDGMEINVPPKGERPDLTPGHSSAEASGQPPKSDDGVLIETVLFRDAVLVILPKDRNKVPLRFDIERLRMESVGKNEAMNYDADLTNPKPPGVIRSRGIFGPWSADKPSDTPLTGDYTFEKADLSVFDGIAGILNSSGQFQGTLGSVRARGQATVPDFRLKSANNPVPLATSFDVVVDGTNGNTILSPVVAILGSSRFTTSGGVIKRVKHAKRTIDLEVTMPKGELKDLLRLAMKGEPFMEGQITLKTKIGIPPLGETVRERLDLDGRFQVSDGKFLRSNIQDQIDTLSRRGQGKPKNKGIDDVFANMDGAFKLDDQVVTFQSLFFAVPGAAIDLTGNFDIGQDQLDFHGALRLQAKVSQTLTGWKRWAVKPVDPFFAKNGAGTFLKVKVEGSSKAPKFGLDRGSNKTPQQSGLLSRE
jgi:AsmA-like protein